MFCLKSFKNEYQVLILFAIILASVSCFAGNIQNKEDIERRQLFDFNWKFALGDYPTANKIDFDDNSWRILDLPHDWSIEGTD